MRSDLKLLRKHEKIQEPCPERTALGVVWMRSLRRLHGVPNSVYET